MNNSELVKRWMNVLQVTFHYDDGSAVNIKEEEYEEVASLLEKAEKDAIDAGYDTEGISHVIYTVIKNFRDCKSFIIG
jgi:hypothetical protein